MKRGDSRFVALDHIGAVQTQIVDNFRSLSGFGEFFFPHYFDIGSAVRNHVGGFYSCRLNWYPISPTPAAGLPPRCLAVVLYTRRGKRDAEISLFSLVQVLFSISILIYKYLSMSVQHLSLTNRSTELIYMHSLYIVFGAVFPH